HRHQSLPRGPLTSDRKKKDGVAKVEAHGTLRVYRMLLWGHTAASVTADGTNYWLDYSSNPALVKRGIAAFDGKKVLVKGLLTFRVIKASPDDLDDACGNGRLPDHVQPV